MLIMDVNKRIAEIDILLYEMRKFSHEDSEKLADRAIEIQKGIYAVTRDVKDSMKMIFIMTLFLDHVGYPTSHPYYDQISDQISDWLKVFLLSYQFSDVILKNYKWRELEALEISPWFAEK